MLNKRSDQAALSCAVVLCPHISSEQWSPIGPCHIWSDSQFVLHCKTLIKDGSTNTRQSTCSSFWHLCNRMTKPPVQEGTHLLCWAQETTVFFRFTLRAGKVKLSCQQLDFLHKMGAVCGQRITEPFLWGHEPLGARWPPRPPPGTDMLCRVMSTSRACMAWRMAEARIAGSLREVLTIKCTLELDFLFWTHHWEREREGKRGDEKKSTETIHTLVCQQGPPCQ